MDPLGGIFKSSLFFIIFIFRSTRQLLLTIKGCQFNLMLFKMYTYCFINTASKWTGILYSIETSFININYSPHVRFISSKPTF